MVALLAGTASAATLAEVLRVALFQHPEVRGARASVQVAEAAVTEARAPWLPHADVSAYRNRSENRSSLEGRGTFEVTHTTGHTLALRQQLFDGGVTGYAVERAEAAHGSARASLDETREATALRIVQAWLDVLAAERQARLAQEFEAENVAILDKITLRGRQGMGSQADVSQAEGRLAQARNVRRTRTGTLEDARTRLARLIDRVPQDLVLPASPPVPDRLADALALAQAANPTLAVAARTREAAAARVEEMRSRHMPTLDLEIARAQGIDRPGAVADVTQTYAQVNFRLALFSGFADDARHRQAVGQFAVEQENEDNARRAVIEATERVWNALATLQETRTHLELQQRASQDVLTAYTDQFTLGRRSLVDVLNAHNERYQAQAALAENDFGMLGARYRLLGVCGQLLDHFGLRESPRGDPQETGVHAH